MVSLGQLMSSSKNPIRQVVHVQVRSRVVVAGGGGVSQESVWSFHQIYYVNSPIVLKFSHSILYLPKEYLIPAIVICMQRLGGFALKLHAWRYLKTCSYTVFTITYFGEHELCGEKVMTMILHSWQKSMRSSV